MVSYLNIRSYPAVLVFTAYGLGLTRSERWHALHSLFEAAISRQHKQPRKVVDELFLETWSGLKDQKKFWNQIDGSRTRSTPLSDHLLRIFAEWGKSFVGLSPDFADVR
jgi:hypothetical protein